MGLEESIVWGYGARYTVYLNSTYTVNLYSIYTDR
jgi:hypothetical protein